MSTHTSQSIKSNFQIFWMFGLAAVAGIALMLYTISSPAPQVYNSNAATTPTPTPDYTVPPKNVNFNAVRMEPKSSLSSLVVSKWSLGSQLSDEKYTSSTSDSYPALPPLPYKYLIPNTTTNTSVEVKSVTSPLKWNKVVIGWGVDKNGKCYIVGTADPLFIAYDQSSGVKLFDTTVPYQKYFWPLTWTGKANLRIQAFDPLASNAYMGEFYINNAVCNGGGPTPTPTTVATATAIPPTNPPSCVPTSSIEICNGKDDNCNGTIDEGGVCTATAIPPSNTPTPAPISCTNLIIQTQATPSNPSIWFNGYVTGSVAVPWYFRLYNPDGSVYSTWGPLTTNPVSGAVNNPKTGTYTGGVSRSANGPFVKSSACSMTYAPTAKAQCIRVDGSPDGTPSSSTKRFTAQANNVNLFRVERRMGNVGSWVLLSSAATYVDSNHDGVNDTNWVYDFVPGYMYKFTALAIPDLSVQPTDGTDICYYVSPTADISITIAP